MGSCADFNRHNRFVLICVAGRQTLDFAKIRELNKHPLNQAALRWLEEGERRKIPWTIGRAMGEEAMLGPSDYYLHALCLLEWAMDETALPPQRREALEHHLELLEADLEQGIQYLLRFPGDLEPTMLEVQLREAEGLEEAGWTILDTDYPPSLANGYSPIH